MLSPALILTAGLLVSQVAPVPFTRVLVNSNNTKEIHVWTTTSPMAVRVDAASIPLYDDPNTPGNETSLVSDVDAEVDNNGNYVVAWRATVLYGGTSYVTVCLSVNGGAAVFVSDASGAPQSVQAGPRVTTSQVPGSTMPITVVWQQAGSPTSSIIGQTFTGNPTAKTVAKLSQPTPMHGAFMYLNRYNLGDVSCGDNGNFVVTYTRDAMSSMGGAVGVIAHGGTYGSNLGTERFPEIAMTDGSSTGMTYSQSEVACYHDGSFVVLFNAGTSQVSSESFYSGGTRVLNSSIRHGLNEGIWNTTYLLTGEEPSSSITPTSLSLACQRNVGGNYIAAWPTRYETSSGSFVFTNYLANTVVQKVKAFAPQAIEFRTAFTDDSPPTFSRAVSVSVTLRDSGSYRLNYIVNAYNSTISTSTLIKF